jgi:hypothetical protein
MLCDRCHSRDAVAREGIPTHCDLFGEIHGYFCAECILEMQQPYEQALRKSIETLRPDLTEADLAAVPDQMLKFTLTFPVERQAS